jgi:hypothetical protein
MPVVLGLLVLSGCAARVPASDTAVAHASERSIEPVAQEDDAPIEAAEESDAEETPLVHALRERLLVRTRRDGERIYAAHCEGAPSGCFARIEALAALLEEAAVRHDLDPYLLAALAVRESMLDPQALGRNGEAGILQLHPRGAGRGVPFVEDEDLRERCEGETDGCQGPIVERGAATLAESIERCGSIRSGLGRYASGRCRDDLRHIDAVLEEQERLRELAE